MEILQYVKESHQVESWDLYEVMKFFLPYHHIQDKEAVVIDSPNHSDVHKDTKYSSIETVRHDNAPAVVKQKKMYRFKLDREDRSLVDEVKQYPILYDQTLGAAKDLRDETWKDVAKNLFGRKYVKNNPESSGKNCRQILISAVKFYLVTSYSY